MPQMPREFMKQLRDIFATYFDTEGLTDFALALGIDYENLSGTTRSAKARELALYLWRHSKLPLLAEVGPAERHDIDWSLLAPYVPGFAASGVVEPPLGKPKLDYQDIQKLLPILASYPLFLTPDGRNTVLVVSGVAPYVNVDLTGSAVQVASSLLVKLNEYGEIAPGDTAVGRLLAFVSADAALPPAHKEVIASVAAKYGLSIG